MASDEANNIMGLSYKGCLVFSQALPSLSFVVAAVGTALGGPLLGWELTR